MPTPIAQKQAATLNLTASEISRLIDIVNDKQDVLFDRLVAVEKIASTTAEPSDRKAAQSRGEGLRETLRFWDGITRQLKATHQKALNAEDSGND